MTEREATRRRARTAAPMLNIVGALAAAAAFSCGGKPAAPAADRAAIEAALSTAGLMMELGLVEAAIGECSWAVENAPPAEPALAARAMLMLGKCELAAAGAKGELEPALAIFRRAAGTHASCAAKASTMAARALIGRWKLTEALETLEGVDPAFEGAAEADELARAVKPVLGLRRSMSLDFRTGSFAERGAASAWSVEDPLRFTLDRTADGCLKVAFQDVMGRLTHLLPWDGGSFRLRTTFRIESIDESEHWIGAVFGIDSVESLSEAKGRNDVADGLEIEIRSTVIMAGRERERSVTATRTTMTPGRLESESRVLSGCSDIPMGEWVTVLVEYSSELAAIMVKTYRKQIKAREIVMSESVASGVSPFGPGPHAFFFGCRGGGAGGIMKVSFSEIIFEFGGDARCEPGPDDPVNAGNRQFFLGDFRAALGHWQKALGTLEPQALLGFKMMKAAKAAGDLPEAARIEREIAERRAEIRPDELDGLDRIARFDPDAAVLARKIREG